MKKMTPGISLLLSLFLLLVGATVVVAEQQPLTPELAAKREMVRKQEEQRITQDKRKVAAEALKAERLRVYQAKEAVKQKNSLSIENK